MTDIAFVALLIAAVLLISRKLERYWISVPMALILLAAPLGDQALGLFTIQVEFELVKALAEVTLGLLLFADASSIVVRSVIREAGLEGRLLSIGLLLTVALGALLAWFVLDDLSVGVALLIGAALAPTDAALGLPIFNNRAIPDRIRQSLNVESGLNDGVVTPIVALAIALALHEAEDASGSWIGSAIKEISIAVAVALVVSAAGGFILRLALERGWTSVEQGKLIFCSLAIAVFFGAQELGGNGFIAAFIGGLVIALVLGSHSAEAVELTETAGVGLSNVVWVIFGAAVVPLAFDELFSWRAVLYASLALTLVRMVPVAIALLGTGLRRDTVAIMGWFGPRGLASVVFLITAYVAFEEAGESPGSFVGPMAWTILLSIFLHGLTATPLGRRYSQRLAAAGPAIPEFAVGDAGAHDAAALSEGD